MNLLQSCTDKIKKKNLVTFFCSPRNFSIRSVATDKLNMTAIYSKWTIILRNRNRLFVILYHVNSSSEGSCLFNSSETCARILLHSLGLSSNQRHPQPGTSAAQGCPLRPPKLYRTNPRMCHQHGPESWVVVSTA